MKEDIIRLIQATLLIILGIIIGYFGYLEVLLIGFIIFLAIIIIKDSFRKLKGGENVRRIKKNTSRKNRN